MYQFQHYVNFAENVAIVNELQIETLGDLRVSGRVIEDQQICFSEHGRTLLTTMLHDQTYGLATTGSVGS
jgi:hypothetical protein